MADLWTSLSTFLTQLGQEAIKTWGSLAIVVTLLVWLLLSTRRENKGLRREVSRLQEQRVQDAQTMIRVAEGSRATMARRSEADAEVAYVLRKGAGLEATVPPSLQQPESR